MPATTTKYKIPYPVAADKVSDYPTTAKQAADKLDALIVPCEFPVNTGKIATPPSSAVQKLAIWSYTGTTNQFGQILIPLPTGFAGITDAIAISAKFDSEDNTAYQNCISLTGANANRPIFTVSRGATRVVNTSLTLTIIARGW